MEKNKITVLVSRVKNGDSDAWEDLIRECSPSVRQLINTTAGSEQADDIFQETMLAVYLNIGKLKNEEAFLSWVYRIALNQCYQAGRGLQKRYQNEEFIRDGEDDEAAVEWMDENIEFRPEESVEQEEIVQIVGEMVDQLPVNQRVALSLHYGDRLSASEIAGVMDVKVNTAKSYLKYGIANLRKQKDDLEKKGIQLRSFTFAPVLYALFRRRREDFTLPLESVQEIIKRFSAAENTHEKASPKAETGNRAGKVVSGKSLPAKTGILAKVGVSKFLAGAAVAAALVGTSCVVGRQIEQQREQQRIEEEQEFLDGIRLQLAELAQLDLMEEENREVVREFIGSDDADRYRDLTGLDTMWTPSDTGNDVTGFYKNGGTYHGSADNGIRTGGKWFCDGTWNYYIDPLQEEYKEWYPARNYCWLYDGEWREDQPNGIGTFYDLSGIYLSWFGEVSDGYGNGIMDLVHDDVDISELANRGFPRNFFTGWGTSGGFSATVDVENGVQKCKVFQAYSVNGESIRYFDMELSDGRSINFSLPMDYHIGVMGFEDD